MKIPGEQLVSLSSVPPCGAPSARRVENQTHRFRRLVPLWEVAAVLQPMQTRIGKARQRTCCLPRQTDTVLMPPHNQRPRAQREGGLAVADCRILGALAGGIR